MKTLENGCGGAKTTTPAKTRKSECLPCEIPAFCRAHYYRGKLLTERDFRDEQRYAIDKHRLHNLALHGWGVVCGLALRRHPHCPEFRFIVEPGLAIDSCGREVRVLEPVEIALPKKPPKKKVDDDCPPDTYEPHAHDDAHEHELSSRAVLDGAGPATTFDDDDTEPPPHHHHPGCGCDGYPKELYVCIRYVECETELSSAPFDDCSCGGSQQPNRVCESYEIVVEDERPKWWDEAIDARCHDDDCAAIFTGTTRGCREHRCYPCIPLGVIHDLQPGEEVGEAQFDNRPRRLLPSIETLDDVVRCILDKLPTRPATRIETFGWSHGRTYPCHEFFSHFVGSDDDPGGFRIGFSTPVDGDPIDTRSFQVTIVFQPDDDSAPRRMEIAPAAVTRGAGSTTSWCTLRIDPAYARRCLDGRSFDVYVSLRCNVITGRNGLPVDGDLLASHRHGDTYRVGPPTGDGIPGGTFTSWITVRSAGSYAE